MKRDMDLIRTILLRVEALPPGSGVEHTELGADPVVVANHMQLLQEEGYVEGLIMHPVAPPHIGARLERLTWKGHEFLDDARNDTVWNKAKERVGKQLGTASLEVLKSVLASIIRSQLGLPPG